MGKKDEPDFYAVMHMDGDDNTFGAGPFKEKAEAEEYQREIEKGRRKCSHHAVVVPMWYGTQQIVMTMQIIDLTEEIDQFMKDKLN